MSKHPLAKSARDNRANQLNPAHPPFHRSRGASAAEAGSLATHAKPALDNRANPRNPNNDVYGRSRDMGPRSGSSPNASSAKSARPGRDA